MKPEKSSSMGWFSTERGQWSEDFGILGQFLGFHHSQHPKKQSITTSSIDLQPIPNQSPRTCKQKDHVGSVLLQVQLSSELLSSSLWCVVVVQWKHVVRVAAGFQGSPTGRCHPGVWAWKRKNQELKKKQAKIITKSTEISENFVLSHKNVLSDYPWGSSSSHFFSSEKPKKIRRFSLNSFGAEVQTSSGVSDLMLPPNFGLESRGEEKLKGLFSTIS